MGAMANISVGQFDYYRVFGKIELGEFTPWGTRAFIAASTSKYNNPFNNYGKLDRQQYNAKVWQPIGSGGDFITVAARYNQDRNNFFGSLPLRWDTTRVSNGVVVPAMSAPETTIVSRATMTSGTTTSTSRARSMSRRPSRRRDEHLREPSSTGVTTRRTASTSAATRSSRSPIS